jgi:hypothetical protein
MKIGRITTLGILAGGITAAALTSASAAYADVYEYTLDDSDFATQASTTPFGNVVQGDTYLDTTDVTTGQTYTFDEFGYGNEVLNPLTGTVESYAITTYNEADNVGGIPDGSAIYVSEFGGGFANELVNIPATSAGALDSITDTLVTPYGDFVLFSL